MSAANNKYILSLDQGTTSSRAIVFDHSGKMTGVAQKEFRQIFPEPGWVEHDPMDIWNSQHHVMHDALRKAGIGAGDLAAIGITNQRETAVLWDRLTGKPLCNAIVWQDRRTSGYCDELKSQGHKEMIQEKTGLVIDAYFSATKWRWMLENVPGAREKANEGRLALGTVDSWLIWKLTEGKVHVTDVTNASRTMLYNINTLRWDDELLELFGIPRSLLPEVKSSSEVYGETAQGTLSLPVPIAGIAGDQQAATFGQMCLTPGSVKCTYGTGCFILCNTGEKPVLSGNNLVTTIAWQVGNKTTYALEGSIFIGGAVIQWLRDGLGIIKKSADVEKLAESVDDNGGVCFVPAFTGLGAPHWDQYARGMIAGLSRGTTAGHIARAALESIAFQVNDVMGAMEDDAGMKIGELRVDGGAVVNDLLMQFQADLLGIPVIRPENIETTALGAAYLAGLAVKFWASVDEIGEQWAMDRTFTSKISEEKRNTLIKEWDKAVSRTRSWENR
ncbi:MAG: glycerol kinase GlpK [Bacteroidia bacterium]|nr:MAG: glycerol kinase GlpK [Bacteroidia bacterium]